MIKILFGLLLIWSTSLALNEPTLYELNHPQRTVFDITEDSGMVIAKIMREVQKVTVEVAKLGGILPRVPYVKSCPTDKFDTEYCPIDLAPCDSSFDITNSSSTAVPSSDATATKEQKVYYECNEDAEATPHSRNDSYTPTSTATSTACAKTPTSTPTSSTYNATATPAYSCTFGYSIHDSDTQTYADPEIWVDNHICIKDSYTPHYPYYKSPTSTTIYTCPYGGTRNGTICTTSGTSYSCVTVGGTLKTMDWYGTTVYYCETTCPSTSYSCPSGGTINSTNTSCVKYSTYYTYACPDSIGGTLDGTICLKTCDMMACPAGYISSDSYQAKASTNLTCNSPYHLENVTSFHANAINNTICLNGTATTTPHVKVSYSCQAGGSLNATTKMCEFSTTDDCVAPNQYEIHISTCPNAPNSQGYNYVPVIPVRDDGYGGTNPSTLTNNCKRLKFTCAADATRPCAYADEDGDTDEEDGTWGCSPFVCDENSKCGKAICINGNPIQNDTGAVLSGVVPFNYSALVGLNDDPICDYDVCDMAVYEKLGQCGIPERCPTAFGVYEVNGHCYKDVCPHDSTEKDLGGGQTTCMQASCPNGYSVNAQGKCSAN